MNLTKQDKINIKKNREWLQSLFQRREQELLAELPNFNDKDKIMTELRFINEMRRWLIDIDIIANPERERKETWT